MSYEYELLYLTRFSELYLKFKIYPLDPAENSK
jgi:hypothetical protein